MSFLELVARRQSVREYLDKPVERVKIERCLEAARCAPSTCNSQPWRFIIVDDPELREKVAKKTFGTLLSFNRFVMEAPALVVVMSEKPNMPARFGAVVKNRQFNLIDVGIAAEHFCLQAVEEGLGSCMLGWFDEEGVKDLLAIPKGRRVDLIIAIGYPASEQIRPKKRKGAGQITSYNSYR